MRTRWVLLVLVMVWTAHADETWRLLFMGDTALASTYPETQRELEKLDRLDKPSQAFDRLRPFLLAQDSVIVNLETALCEQLESPLTGRKDYLHADPPLETAHLLRENGVRVASLANNHVEDFGLEGLRSTCEALETAGIATIGAGPALEQAARPWVFAPAGCRRPLAVFSVFETRATYLQKYDWYATADHAGVAGFDAERLRARIQALRAESPDAFVVLFPHWGSNYQHRRERQQEMARAAIDAGVDLILGHGSHFLQELECYRGRWIVYSLGNGVFLTPGQFALAKLPGYSALAQLVVTAAGPMVLRLYPTMGDNLKTSFETRFLNRAESAACWRELLDRSGLTKETAAAITVNPTYLEISLQTAGLP